MTVKRFAAFSANKTLLSEFAQHFFLIEIRKRYPYYRQKIHVILDGAGYHRTQLIKDWAFIVNIDFHYLPPYSLNLNAIERLWRIMNDDARSNRYFENTREFRDAILNFLTSTLPK